MKRSFVSLLLVLLLGLMLVGCAGPSDGIVGTSPAPMTATPALPVPSAEVSMAPVPGETAKPRGDSTAKQDGGATSGVSPSPAGDMQ